MHQTRPVSSLVAMLLMFGAPTLQADVAPTPMETAVTILPRSAGSDIRDVKNERGFQFNASHVLRVYPDAPVDVTMASEHVKLTLMPTMLLVEASFELTAGDQGAKALEVGFPERFPGFNGVALSGFEAMLNGERLPARLQTRRQNPDDVWFEDVWWVWKMDFAPHATHKLQVRYVQELTSYQEPKVEFGAAVYVLVTGGAWKGTIGRATLELELRDVPRNKTRIFWQAATRFEDRGKGQLLTPETAAGPLQLAIDGGAAKFEDRDTKLLWRFDDLEPTHNLAITFQGIEIPKASRLSQRANYLPPSAGRALELYDLFLRLPRSRADLREDPQRHEQLIDHIVSSIRRLSHSSDPCERLLAADLAAQLSVFCEDEEEPEWLQDDGKHDGLETGEFPENAKDKPLKEISDEELVLRREPQPAQRKPNRCELLLLQGSAPVSEEQRLSCPSPLKFQRNRHPLVDDLRGRLEDQERNRKLLIAALVLLTAALLFAALWWEGRRRSGLKAR